MAEKKSAPQDVDAYLDAAAEKMRAALRALRATIRAAAPEAEEVMRMGAPTYLYHGNLVSFSAAAKHCAFYVMSRGPVDQRKDALAGYDTAPSAIRFQPDAPLPEHLVTDIVRDRMRENEAKRK
jgi:uncharacterized protein YdhG (YjbR/CyaY superfamily)